MFKAVIIVNKDVLNQKKSKLLHRDGLCLVSRYSGPMHPPNIQLSEFPRLDAWRCRRSDRDRENESRRRGHRPARRGRRRPAWPEARSVCLTQQTLLFFFVVTDELTCLLKTIRNSEIGTEKLT